MFNKLLTAYFPFQKLYIDCYNYCTKADENSANSRVKHSQSGAFWQGNFFLDDPEFI